MFRSGFRAFRPVFRRPVQSNNVQSRAYRQQRFGDSRPRAGWRNFALAGLTQWAAKPTFYRDVGVITAGAGGFYLYNLEEVPVSGRRRFNCVSPNLEAWLGKRAVNGVKEEYKGKFLPASDPRVRQVKNVLQRLLPYVKSEGLSDVEWEVNVIDSPEMNAFVAPGGKVFVFTGILPLCRDENGIAAVLGHEIAHVVARHSAERLSQSPLVLLGALLLTSIDFSLYTSIMLLNVFLSWPGSRKQEAEADYIGLLMMAEGCYRPEAAMEFWSRMNKQAVHQAPPELLSTHPSDRNREEKIREWLPQAHQKAESSDCYDTMNYAGQFAKTLGGSWWA
ncbi:hypothetical protein P280DRAFT_335547 [Massarina eburnea CBS 473.64]|uniref:Peptidase M48 domain-containing protein n=1 Tax=Massarina eburnea CBS 473.64 TaxID=1395130 RepID=A0A6A6RJE5_9PLEO|nr:hypothetical protein P280DRAFT_335547 [Massarina eburnea CBS 473.64]